MFVSDFISTEYLRGRGGQRKERAWVRVQILSFFYLVFISLQDQLDEYEAERNALLCQNSQAKDEVKP